MQSRSRDRLAYPIAAIVALGLVTVPNPTTAVPRLVDVTNVRLEAEVTTLITAVSDVPAVRAAATAGALTGSSPAATCTYPCTIFDKWLTSLPDNVRNALLPPLYAISFVVGLVLAPVALVTSALFGWPYSLRPAASTAPAPAAARVESVAPVPVAVPADVSAPSSTPGVDRGVSGPPVVANEPAEPATVAVTRGPHPGGRTPDVPRAAATIADRVTTEATPDSANPAGAQPARMHSRASHGGTRDASAPAAGAAKRSAR